MRLALVLLFASGCMVPDDDPLTIGRFEVTATRKESCGDEVYLASPAAETFWVFLRKTSEQVMLWDDGRDRWPLSLEADGSFSGAAQLSVAMESTTEAEPTGDEPPDPLEEEMPPTEDPTCVMLRVDRIEGQLSDGSFEGDLAHDFAAREDTDCSALMAAPLPLADSLPCTVAYHLNATRIP